jgi:hypothetical protein
LPGGCVQPEHCLKIDVFSGISVFCSYVSSPVVLTLPNFRKTQIQNIPKQDQLSLVRTNLSKKHGKFSVLIAKWPGSAYVFSEEVTKLVCSLH